MPNTRTSRHTIASTTRNPSEKLLAAKTKELQYLFKNTSFYQYRIREYVSVLLAFGPTEIINTWKSNVWYGKPLFTDKDFEEYEKSFNKLKHLIVWWNTNKTQFIHHKNTRYFEAISQENKIFDDFKRSPSLPHLLALQKHYQKITQLFEQSSESQLEQFPFETLMQDIQWWLEDIKKNTKKSSIDKVGDEIIALSTKKSNMMGWLYKTLQQAAQKQFTTAFPHDALHLFNVYFKHIDRLTKTLNPTHNSEEQSPSAITRLHLGDLQNTIDEAVIQIIQTSSQSSKHSQYNTDQCFRALTEYYEVITALEAKERTFRNLYTQDNTKEAHDLDHISITSCKMKNI